MTEITQRLAAALADRYRIELELGQGGWPPSFQRGEQRVLFGIGSTYTDRNETYVDVSPDDRRSLMVRRNVVDDDAAQTTTAVLVQHWLTELRRERPPNR